MFVGHALLAFALVAVLGHWLGWDRSLALRVAVLAGLFATLPDVDILYGPIGLALAGPDPSGLAESFWAAGNQLHRGVTHSLLVGAATGLAVGALARDGGRSSAAGLAALGGIVAVTGAVSGGLEAVVALLFALGAVALVAIAESVRVPARCAMVAALVGLLSHPFGDLLTGSPPAMAYPFDATLVAQRVVLSGDPTLHLLGAFAVELATLWLAVAAYLHVTDRRVADHVHRRAALGAAYGAAALAIPAPTLEVSYHFVFSVLGTGAVVVAPPSLARPRGLRPVVTALATITVAVAAYAVTYVALGAPPAAGI